MMIEKGVFREDLYYRLAAITIVLPSLRERKSDIPEISQYLLDQINVDFQSQEPNFKHKFYSVSAKNFVRQHSWPGNVRQLNNILLQVVVMSDSEEISFMDLKAAIDTYDNRRQQSTLEQPLETGFNLESHLDEIQKHYIKKALSEENGIKAQAAKLLGLKNYQTLDAKIESLKIKV